MVLPQVAVDVAGQHQVDHGPARAVLADFQTAVVDKALGRLRIHRKHRGVHVRFTYPHRHGEDRPRNDVL